MAVVRENLLKMHQFISIFSELWEITLFKIVNTCTNFHNIPVLTVN